MTSRQGISRSKVQGEMLVTGLQAWDEDVQQSSENWLACNGPSVRQVVMLALYTGIADSNLGQGMGIPLPGSYELSRH